MINKYFNNGFRERLQNHAEQFGIKGKQAVDIIALTKSTVKEILRAELKTGNFSGVIAFLKSTPVQVGTNAVVNNIIQRLVGRLILRFGLPGAVALNVATLLVPFILKRISKKALKSGKVQDFLNSVGIKDQVEKLDILKHQVKGKFSPGRAA